MNINCPDCNLEKEERITKFFDHLERWMHSDALLALIELFGGNVQVLKAKEDFKSYLEWILEFSEVWNYRKTPEKSIERMFLEDSEFMIKHKDVIIDKVKELGLIGKVALEDVYNVRYVLPLGGARYTCLHRPLMSKKMIEKYQLKNATVVGVTGIRPLNEGEIEIARTYSKTALNEYELMCAGIEKTFGVDEYREKEEENENIFLKTFLRKYENKDEKGIFVLAAPSSDPKRRANTVDTYSFFFENFPCEKGDKIVLVTSQIYVGVQLLQFMPFAIEKELNVEIVGVDDEISGNGLSKPVNYLQELRGTIDLIDQLYRKYREEG